jgi:hypothetical protein
MSAWIVSKAHIDALVSAAMFAARDNGGSFRWYDTNGGHEITYTETMKASEIGMMLWGENLASINSRYPDTIEYETACPGPCDFEGSISVAGYSFKRTPRLAAVVILKQIACYEYQSCEHEGWKTSQAKAFCDSLTASMINSLPGYNDAPWGLDEINA